MIRITQVVKLTFMGFITGYLPAVLLQEWTWLEMRTNIALAIPLCTAVGLAAGVFIGRVKGYKWLIIEEGLILIILVIIYKADLGAILTIPAALLRDGFGFRGLNLNLANIILALIMLFGNGIWLINKEPQR